MSATDLNIAGPLRTALMDNSAITDLLGTWHGEPSIHTRRPIPGDAEYPLIVINPDAAISDADMLVTHIPVVTRDIAIYGKQAADYRSVETLGYLIRGLFHDQKGSIIVPNFHVLDIRASGPIAGPTDDDEIVGRIVSLTVRLQDLE